MATLFAIKIISSKVMGRVVVLPHITFDAESPTNKTSTPAWSKIEAIEKSYAVSMLIFSPLCFISDKRWVVTLRISSLLCTDISLKFKFQAAKVIKKMRIEK